MTHPSFALTQQERPIRILKLARSRHVSPLGVGGIQVYTYWYDSIALIPFRYIFVCLSYQKLDTGYTVK